MITAFVMKELKKAQRILENDLNKFPKRKLYALFTCLIETSLRSEYFILPWDHSFSKFAKFPNILNFLLLETDTYVCISGGKNVRFSRKPCKRLKWIFPYIASHKSGTSRSRYHDARRHYSCNIIQVNIGCVLLFTEVLTFKVSV